MSAFETLIFEKVDHVATVTLNRPRALNAHNVQMRDDMIEVLGAIRDDDEVRVVVFKGAGEKAFCAGADISEFLTAPSPTAAREIRFDGDLWGLFLRMPQILIAAVHGYVLGSGIEIALCCDICIASENARFGLPEMDLGMIPAAGGTQTIPRAVGTAKAMEMTLTNRWIDAKAALKASLVNRVVPENMLYTTVDKLADGISLHHYTTVKAVKEAINRGMDLPLSEGLDLEDRIAGRIMKGTQACF
ncbi:MAG: enoyl-CoA hydratase/isomerase family protein [Desulfobacterales bacterium]